MTFGIGFICPHYAGIVTDRLLSGGSSADDSDKCGSVNYVDGRFVYTFAGLAEVPRYEFQTRQRLAQALGEAGAPSIPGGSPTGAKTALERVARYMTDATSTMPVRLRDKRMSILFAGYRVQEDGEQLSGLHLVSNFEQLSGPASPVARSEFAVSSLEIHGVALWWIGCAELSQQFRTSTLNLLEQSRVVPPWEIVKLLVAEIREAAREDPERIGRRCSSIVALRDELPFQIDYHSDEAVDKVDATATVVALYGNVGAFYTIDQRLTDVRHSGQSVPTSVPVVHKRQSCPCGSGRQYKNCHGNRRAVRVMDSYSFKGRTKVLAMPEDGSELTIFTNEIFGR